ncbi:TonB-dependent receptor plug domain-containing protein [Sphingomonas lenta]|uniref:TonB-dependent receptor n=1 Tax=Sphingomonas lenta TaxID=1141887 RepID=A0A2A2SBU1_9SPHN|nr:TonB-dependent receptor [Sphingomonas lenta]PAX06727.1 TonB-dependent receptor [Sphingomonas lenta]
MLLVTLALAAQAQAPLSTADNNTDQPRGADVVVTANRTERPIEEVAQSVTVITSDEIRDRQAQTVVDLLRTVPGVTLTRNGGPGSVAGLNIRGAENDQNVVLIDGVKLNDPSAVGGGFNFATLLVNNIDRIEVVRGSQSVIWGSQAIGGVVNLLTAPPTDDLRVNARGEYGWRDTAQAVANVSGRVGPAALSAGAGYFRTDGFSAFAGGAERDGYQNVGANAKALIGLSDAVAIDLRGFYSDGETEIDGFPAPLFAFADTAETGRTRELTGYAGLNAALLDGRFRNRVAFAYTRTDRENEDAGATTFDAQGENERFEYQGVLDLGRVDAVFGAETERSSYRAASYGGPPAGADVRITSVYGELTLQPVAGLTLTGGVRHDDHQTFGGETTVAASSVFSPNGGATRLRASYGEGFKAPSLFQLYSDFGDRGLQPERSESWEVGVAQNLGGEAAELSATYFHRDIDNQIDFAFCPPAATSGPCVNRPFGVYANTRLTRAEGVELTLALRPVERLRLLGQYSFIDAVNRDTGGRLARRPRETFSVVADYEFPWGLQAGATLSAVGDSFDDAANATRLDGYVLADLRAAVALTDRVELYGRVENLFDEEYQTVFRYGAASRAAYGGVRLRL